MAKRTNNNGPRANKEPGGYQPWFRTRRARNRKRDEMAKESRRINRRKK